jgi:hypothetical protein
MGPLSSHGDGISLAAIVLAEEGALAVEAEERRLGSIESTPDRRHSGQNVAPRRLRMSPICVACHL